MKIRIQRFDPDKVLLDPYGRAVAVPEDYRRIAASAPGRNDRWAMKSVVVDDHAYDWEGDTPLRRPFAQTVIYELHVRGFTRHPSSGVAPGPGPPPSCPKTILSNLRPSDRLSKPSMFMPPSTTTSAPTGVAVCGTAAQVSPWAVCSRRYE